MWIAGGGEKKTLRIAAQHADHTNFAGTLEAFTHKSEVLAGHCRDLGTDFNTITRSANYNMAIGATDKEVQDRLSWYREHLTRVVGAAGAEHELGQIQDLPGMGTPEQIIDNFRALEQAGMTYAILYFPELAYDTSGFELFERAVIPALS